MKGLKHWKKDFQQDPEDKFVDETYKKSALRRCQLTDTKENKLKVIRIHIGQTSLK